jgi:hypothetical protein
MTSSDWGEDTGGVVYTPGSTRESTPTAVDTIHQETTTEATSISAQKTTTSDIETNSIPEFSIGKLDAKVDNGTPTNQYESSSENSSK